MPTPELRLSIFRVAITIYALMALIPLGIMHVFFPDQYFSMIQYKLWDPNDPVQREMVELIGSFFIAVSLGAWRVRRDILRNRDLFIVLIAASVMTEAVVVYTILIGVAPHAVWFNTILPYGVLLLTMVTCYPWRDASRYGIK